MTAAIFYGASSGALHAVSGPDHVLSLGPVALAHPRDSWRIGLSWGVGHALGTLLLALPLLLASELFSLSFAAALGNRFAGAALLVMAVSSWWSSRRAHAAARTTGRPFGVGIVHGVTGAGSLVILLPVVVSNTLAPALFFLLAFSVGSALAMAALTWAMARLGGRLTHTVQERARNALLWMGGTLGAFWMIGG